MRAEMKNKKMETLAYKHATHIPRWNEYRNGPFHVVSTWNTRGMFVGSYKITAKNRSEY